MQVEGWEIIYKEEAIHLQRICMRYLNDEQLAQDIVQDAFVIAIEKETDIKHEEKRRLWLKKIAINEAFKYLKKNKRFDIIDVDELEDIKDHNEDETENDKRKVIENANFTKQDIINTVNEMPSSQKTVFTLYVLEEYSHKEIAELLTINETASRTILVRARKTIQNLLYEKAMNKNIKNKKDKKKALLLLPLFMRKKSKHYIDDLVRKNWEDAPIKHTNTKQGWKDIIHKLPNNIQNQIIAKNSFTWGSAIKMFVMSAVAVGSISGDSNLILNKQISLLPTPTTLTAINENFNTVDTVSIINDTSTIETDFILNDTNLLDENSISYKNTTHTNTANTPTFKTVESVHTNTKHSQKINGYNKTLPDNTPVKQDDSIRPIMQEVTKTINFVSPANTLENKQNTDLKINANTDNKIITTQIPPETISKIIHKDTSIATDSISVQATLTPLSKPINETMESSNPIKDSSIYKSTIPKHEFKCMLGVFPYIVQSMYTIPYSFKSDMIRMLSYTDIYQTNNTPAPTYEYIRTYTVGSFAINYNCLQFKNHQFGGSLSITSIVNEVYRDAAFKEFITLFRENHWGILTHYQYNYFDKNYIKLYSGVHLGCEINYKEQARFSFSAVHPTGQLTIVGVTFGKRWFGNAELGFGNFGIVRLGVGYRFQEIK